MKRPRVSGAAWFVVAGALVLAAGVAFFIHRRPEEGLGKERILLARISFDERWSPCTLKQTAAAPGYCRTPEEVAQSVEPRQLRGLEGPERRPVLIRLLLDRRGRWLEPVISQLETDAARSPREADAFVDLSAAQLTAGWVKESAARFVDALESADRAFELEPANARACFNRAFALEELGLRDLALEGWEKCELLEEDPQWKAEAHQRAETLRVQPSALSRKESRIALEEAIRSGSPDELGRWARDNPHLATDLVARDLLSRWVEAGPIEGAAWWPGLERLAEEVRSSTGDRLLADIVSQMRTALAEGHSGEVAEGILRLQPGFDDYRAGRYEQAVDPLTAGGNSLRTVPALGMVARAYGAVALHSSKQIGAAKEELARIVAEAGERGYSWPLGYAHWTLGRIAMQEGRPLAALDDYGLAVEAFERIRAEVLVLSVRVMIAEAYSALGQPEPAWESARRALLDAHRLGDEGQLFFVLNLLASVADEQDRPGLALYAQTSSLAHAPENLPRSEANAHLWRAFFLDRKGFQELAWEELRSAEALVSKVTDSMQSHQLEVEVDLMRGLLEGQTDPEAAAASLREAADLSRRLGDRFLRLYALKARAEVLRKIGRVEEAVEDLEEAMALYDESARKLAEGEGGLRTEPERLSFLRQNSDVYQTVIDLLVEELESPMKALLFAEHAKSLRTPGRLPELDRPEDAIEHWTRALPPESAFLSYGMAGDLVVAWVLTPSGRELVRLGKVEEVDGLIGRLDRAGDAETWEARSQDLYQLLVGPLETWVRDRSRLLISPGPGLDRVPFAGLLDARTGQYLAETHLLEMLPSADALLREDDPAKPVRRALVVGDPKPTNAGLLGLGALRFAEQEARDAAIALGEGSVLLLGPDATPARFGEQATGAEVIHVAGHALALGRGLDSAALVLAVGDGDEEGLLTAREVLDLPLSGTELVVLSACSSAGGAAISWQSGLTLGRSFLSAGADQVIATLRAVDDEESARLFQAFYDEFATGNDAVASLSRAQKKEILLRRSRDEGWTPPSWPYVIILGSRPSH